MSNAPYRPHARPSQRKEARTRQQWLKAVEAKLNNEELTFLLQSLAELKIPQIDDLVGRLSVDQAVEELRRELALWKARNG